MSLASRASGLPLASTQFHLPEPCMRLFCAVASLAALLSAPLTGLLAEDSSDAAQGPSTAESGAPSQEYLDQKAELEGMLTKRDVELYEMNCEPITLDRIVITSRSGTSEVFNYLIFRVRNEISDKTSTPLSKAKGFNDVLAAIQQQFEGQVSKVDENGVKLQVEGVPGKEGTIVERQDAQIHQKKLSITVFAYDEHGTRLRLLEEPIGTGAQETFNFPDLGVTSWSAVAGLVKDKIEEKEGRELYSLDQIRTLDLPPYSPTEREKNGWAKGEVYGVAMFHKLSDYGNHFTCEVRGLSNKFRIRWPDADPGHLENYLDAKFFRRVYVMHYDRSGDEFYRELDPFSLSKAGWEWVDTFQRNAQRRSMAYARYFLTNIQSDKTGERNTAIEDEFWPYYQDVRAAHPDKAEGLPDLQQTVKAPGQ
jgi:hypothetical protein